MRNSIKTLLFVSAFSPVLITIALARVFANGLSLDELWFAIAGLAGCLLVLATISTLQYEGEVFDLTFKKIESNDAIMFNVVASYFLPFFGKLSDVSAGAIAGLVGALYAVFWFTGATLPSPLLRLMSYRFYKAESDNGVVYTVLTNRDLLDPKQLKRVKKISNSMLLEAWQDEPIRIN